MRRFWSILGGAAGRGGDCGLDVAGRARLGILHPRCALYPGELYLLRSPFTVPAGVTAVTADATGADGGLIPANLASLKGAAAPN